MDDATGFLSPIVYDLDLNFGESFLHHENWFTAICMW